MSYDLKASQFTVTDIIRINSTPTEVKIDHANHLRRHHLTLNNTSSYFIWWGFDPNIQPRECNLLRSGHAVEIPLDRNDVDRTKIYAIADLDDVQLFVTEVV